ncbi:hypothetical protein DA2_0835 [Desulfovibrio sp. A2]|nr:hypothetical protein DA2_0835 [Desulfovibrio sp. A2]
MGGWKADKRREWRVAVADPLSAFIHFSAECIGLIAPSTFPPPTRSDLSESTRAARKAPGAHGSRGFSPYFPRGDAAWNAPAANLRWPARSYCNVTDMPPNRLHIERHDCLPI